MTYIAMILLAVIAYAILVARKNRIQSQLTIVRSESKFTHSGYYCHPSKVDSWVECKVGNSDILIHFKSYVRYSLWRTRISPSPLSEHNWITINGASQDAIVAKLFLQKFWPTLKIEPLEKAATGFAQVRTIVRGQSEQTARQEQDKRARVARELSEARKKIVEL